MNMNNRFRRVKISKKLSKLFIRFMVINALPYSS